MSEAFPGLPRMDLPPARVRDAAAVVMYRRVPGQDGVEVFWLRREKQLRFAGGFYAFPGGKVDKADAEIPVVGAEGPEAARVVAAARELLEEAGVLVARGASVSQAELDGVRRALLEEDASFKDLLASRGLTLHREDFRDAGRWITPPFLPVRFDAYFYLVQAPADAKVEVWPGELAYGAWVRPSEAIAQWEAGTALMHPPNLHAMRVLAAFDGGDESAVLHALRNPPHCPDFIAQRIEFQRGVHLFPLRTDTLPPATHTNAYVVGNGELLIVDPGTDDAEELARLYALLDGMVAEGRRPTALFLTHHHSDHVGGALAVKQRLGIPLWCHARTADRLPAGAADRLLEDGEVITLDGAPPMRLRVLHTPGHARGHLCLVDEETRGAIVGDMVAGVGTIVIDPPEGDMGDYLAQLLRLRDLPVATLFPSHGAAIPDGPGKLDEYLEHRAAREKLVLGAVSGNTLKEIVSIAYSDTPEIIHPVAERSALAILEKLEREGRVRREGDRWTV